MAVSLKVAIFYDPQSMCAFAADAGNSVVTIIDIEADGSGRLILYYLET